MASNPNSIITAPRAFKLYKKVGHDEVKCTVLTWPLGERARSQASAVLKMFSDGMRMES